MDLLILLVARQGQLVSRNEIVDTLWGKDVFVDVENGVNTAIRKLRQALRDSPDTPAFIETVPGKGYRFIAAVEASLLMRWPRAAPCCPTAIRTSLTPTSTSGTDTASANARSRFTAWQSAGGLATRPRRAPCRGGSGRRRAGRGSPLAMDAVERTRTPA